MTKYQAVIGLEIHAELKTNTKVFCACPNEFGLGDNTSCCPVCMGLPGSLPVLNQKAVEFAIMGGLSLNCGIASYAAWDRKNYFYPDNPKAYQISQMYAPVCLAGGLEIGGKLIRINHIHLEEDAGKLVHEGRFTHIDLNRCSVPLIEIVTEPDMRSAEEAVQFMEAVREALVYAGVCDGKMEQGSMRADANVSVMPVGSNVFGTRTETKNLNSFKHIKAAIEHEIERHIAILESGGAVRQETRRFLVESGTTEPLRSKENAEDYRYFPDPDILPIEITKEDVARMQARLPELPASRRKRYVETFKFAPIDAETLLAEKAVSDLFDASVALGAPPAQVLNLIKGEIKRQYKDGDALRITPQDIARLLALLAEGKLSNEGVKKGVGYIFAEGISAEEAVKKHALIIQEDPNLVAEVIAAVLRENGKAVAQYQAGDEKVLGFLIGQCNRVLRGKVTIGTLQSALVNAIKN